MLTHIMCDIVLYFFIKLNYIAFKQVGIVLESPFMVVTWLQNKMLLQYVEIISLLTGRK